MTHGSGSVARVILPNSMFTTFVPEKTPGGYAWPWPGLDTPREVPDIRLSALVISAPACGCGSSPRKRTQRKVFFSRCLNYSGELLANLPIIFQNNGNKNFFCFMIGWGYRTYICPKIVVNEQRLPFAMFLLSVL